MMRVVVYVVTGFAAGLLTLAGCSQPSVHAPRADEEGAPAVPLARTNQVIIKFRDADKDPSRNEVLRSLSQGAGAELVYVRPMSGGTHVFQFSGDLDARRVLEKLKQHPDVEYAEPDRLLRHQ